MSSPSTEPRTVAAQLRDVLPRLPRAEQRVARALLAGYPTAGLEPLAIVAGLAQTSPATVLRLAYRLGFDGYPELQQTLKRETQQRYSSPWPSTAPPGRATRWARTACSAGPARCCWKPRP